MYAAGRTVSKTAAVQTRQLFLLSLSDILFIDNACMELLQRLHRKLAVTFCGTDAFYSCLCSSHGCNIRNTVLNGSLTNVAVVGCTLLAIAFLPFRPEVFSASSILPVLYSFSCWGLCRQSGYTVPADGHRYGRERYPAGSSTPSGSDSW